MNLSTPHPQIPRDLWGRPMVVPPEGGPAIPYRRCTSYVDVIDDKFALDQWKQRMVAIGLSERRDLALAVAAHKDDKTVLNRVCKDAMEAAKAHAAATTGTALHSLTEQLDRGLEVTNVPMEYVADLAAYTEATSDLEPVLIEQFCVLDALKIGGTPDRVVEYQGRRYIADLKTGSIEYGALKIAAQLAVYARSHIYDVTTGERGTHDADLARGIVVHSPAGTGTTQLYWVDLMVGWTAVRTARDVWTRRATRFKDVCEPFEQTQVPAPVTPPIDVQIKGCSTADEVRALWTPEWTDELNDLARAHIATLAAAS